MQMVKVNSKVCARCKYRINVEQKPCCNYIEVEGHSRIFEDGKPKYDPAYCDKYEAGPKSDKRSFDLTHNEYDEYELYRCQMFGAKKQGSRNRGTKQRGRADMYEG